jgi:hypothetical protein
MWRLIESNDISKELKIGHIISDNNSQHENFQIIEIKDNGIAIAAKTDARNYMIIFPLKELVDSNWWMTEKTAESPE